MAEQFVERRVLGAMFEVKMNEVTLEEMIETG
jgi:hypothetical protein